MKTTKYLFILFVSFLVQACSSGEQKADKSGFDGDVKNLEVEVMALHDEVMEKMPELKRLKKDVNTRLKASEAETEELAETTKTNLEKAETLLSTAIDEMNNWMKAYEKPGHNDKEKAMQYLEKEKQKMQRIKEQTEAALKHYEKNLSAK